jgi:hypothetical protein
MLLPLLLLLPLLACGGSTHPLLDFARLRSRGPAPGGGGTGSGGGGGGAYWVYSGVLRGAGGRLAAVQGLERTAPAPAPPGCASYFSRKAFAYVNATDSLAEERASPASPVGRGGRWDRAARPAPAPARVALLAPVTLMEELVTLGTGGSGGLFSRVQRPGKRTLFSSSIDVMATDSKAAADKGRGSASMSQDPYLFDIVHFPGVIAKDTAEKRSRWSLGSIGRWVSLSPPAPAPGSRGHEYYSVLRRPSRFDRIKSLLLPSSAPDVIINSRREGEGPGWLVSPRGPAPAPCCITELSARRYLRLQDVPPATRAVFAEHCPEFFQRPFGLAKRFVAGAESRSGSGIGRLLLQKLRRG